MRLCARTRSSAGGARWPWCTRFALADVLREHGDDLDALAREFSAFTDRELVPWFRGAVVQDEQARMAAAGEEFPSEDPRAFMQTIFRDGLLPALRTSPVVFRAFLRSFNLLTTPDALISDAGSRGRGDGRVPRPREPRPARPPRSARPRHLPRASAR